MATTATRSTRKTKVGPEELEKVYRTFLGRAVQLRREFEKFHQDNAANIDTDAFASGTVNQVTSHMEDAENSLVDLLSHAIVNQ